MGIPGGRDRAVPGPAVEAHARRWACGCSESPPTPPPAWPGARAAWQQLAQKGSVGALRARLQGQGQPGLAEAPRGPCLGWGHPGMSLWLCPCPVRPGPAGYPVLPALLLALSLLGPSSSSLAVVPVACPVSPRAPFSLSIPGTRLSNHACAAESPGHDGCRGGEPEGASLEEHCSVSEGA